MVYFLVINAVRSIFLVEKLKYLIILERLFCLAISVGQAVQGNVEIIGRKFIFMLKVKSRTGESVQQMMRRFKKLCEKEGLIRDIKKISYYEKPSEKNRRRMRKAHRNAQLNSKGM